MDFFKTRRNRERDGSRHSVDNRWKLDGSFAEMGIRDDSYPDFYLRLDVMLSSIISSTSDILWGISEQWEKFFPDIQGSQQLFEFTETFYRRRRQTVIDLIATDVLSPSYKYGKNLERLAARYFLMLLLDDKTFTSTTMTDKVFESCEGIMGNKSLIEEAVSSDIHNYFGDKEIYKLDDNTLSILTTNRQDIKAFCEKISAIVKERGGKVITDERQKMILERRRLDGAFEAVGIWEKDYPDFFLRIDILLAKIVCSGKNMQEGIEAYWSVIFPDIPGTPRIYEYTRGFYWSRRESAIDLMEKDVLSEHYRFVKNLQRFVVRYLLLVTLDETPFTVDSFTEKLYQLLVGVTSDKTLVREEVESCLHNYFGDKQPYRIKEETLKLLKDNRDDLHGVYYMVCEILKQKKEGVPRHNIFSSRFNVVKLEALLETCYLDYVTNQEDYRSEARVYQYLIGKHWKEFYPNMMLDGPKFQLLEAVVKEDDFLFSLRTLINARSVKDIRSAWISRLLAYGYTMKYVITLYGKASEFDNVIDETLEMASQINFAGMDSGEEQAILEKLAERYASTPEVLDSEIIEYILTEKETVSAMYNSIKKAFNSRYASKSLEEKDRIISELQERVEYEDIRALCDMVSKLSDKNFGSVLNELYLISISEKNASIEEVRKYLRGLFYILDGMSIRPVYSDKIGHVFTKTDNMLHRCRLEGGSNSSANGYRLIYPGWEVSDREAVPPVCIPVFEEGGK